MIPSREHFLLKRRNALSTFSFSPTLTVDILFHPPLPDAFFIYYVIIAISSLPVKSFFAVFSSFLGIFPFLSFLLRDIYRLLSFLRNLFKILCGVLTPRTNKIVGKILALVYVAAYLTHPFMFGFARFRPVRIFLFFF